jgi:hypothetical protein
MPMLGRADQNGRSNLLSRPAYVNPRAGRFAKPRISTRVAPWRYGLTGCRTLRITDTNIRRDVFM